jgi:hypothetical protein
MEGQARAKIDVTRVVTAVGGLPVADAPLAVADWLHRLCRAVLDDALQSLGSHGRRQREAREWVQPCFSLVWVCAVLNLDADAVRKQLLL